MASMAPFGNYYLIVATNDDEKKAVEQIIRLTTKYRKMPITQSHQGKSRNKLNDWWLSPSGIIIAKDYSQGSKLCNVIDAKVKKMNSRAPKSRKRKIDK